MEFREHFSESSYDVVHYELYQPIVEKVAPIAKKLKLTPNKLSIIRLVIVFVVVGIMLYVKNNRKHYIFWLVFVSLLIFFCGVSDDLDGYMARKYDMKTEIGAQLDVAVDFCTFLLMNYTVYKYVGPLFYSKMIPIGFVIMAYKLKEKEFFLNKEKISDFGNFFTHIFMVYIWMMWLIVLIT